MNFDICSKCGDRKSKSWHLCENKPMKLKSVIYTKCTEADKALAKKRVRDEGFENVSHLMRTLLRTGTIKK